MYSIFPELQYFAKDMLGFDREKMTELARFALAVLEQDFEKIANTAKKSVEKGKYLDKILCYLEPIINSIMKLDGKELYYYTLTPMTFYPIMDDEILLSGYEYDEFINDGGLEGDKYNAILERLKQLGLNKVWDGTTIKNKKSIVFRNFIFTGDFDVSTVDKVTFIDCVFTGGRDSYDREISFKGVNNIEFHNCIMKEIKGHLIRISKTQSTVIMENCSVMDCDYLIHDEEGSTISIYDSVFKNMYAGDGYYTGAGPAICYHGETPSIYLENCEFYNCRGSYLFYAPKGWDGQKHINLKEENSHYKNCCPIAKNY